MVVAPRPSVIHSFSTLTDLSPTGPTECVQMWSRCDSPCCSTEEQAFIPFVPHDCLSSQDCCVLATVVFVQVNTATQHCCAKPFFCMHVHLLPNRSHNLCQHMTVACSASVLFPVGLKDQASNPERWPFCRVVNHTIEPHSLFALPLSQATANPTDNKKMLGKAPTWTAGMWIFVMSLLVASGWAVLQPQHARALQGSLNNTFNPDFRVLMWLQHCVQEKNKEPKKKETGGKQPLSCTSPFTLGDVSFIIKNSCWHTLTHLSWHSFERWHVPACLQNEICRQTIAHPSLVTLRTWWCCLLCRVFERRQQATSSASLVLASSCTRPPLFSSWLAYPPFVWVTRSCSVIVNKTYPSFLLNLVAPIMHQ